MFPMERARPITECGWSSAPGGASLATWPSWRSVREVHPSLTQHHGRLRCVLVTGAALMFGGACEESEPPIESTGVLTAEPSVSVSSDDELPDVAPTAAQSTPFGGKLAEEVERFDPSVDGWRSEAFHEAARAQLTFLGRQLEKSREALNASEIESYFSSTFRSPALRPETSALQLTFQDASVEVRSGPEEWVPPAGDLDPLRALLGFFEAVEGSVRCASQIQNLSGCIVRCRLGGRLARWCRPSGIGRGALDQSNSTRSGTSFGTPHTRRRAFTPSFRHLIKRA